MMKKVAYAYYVHKSNIAELLSILNEEDAKLVIHVIDTARIYLLLDFDIIKFDVKTRNTSLIQASTWDTLNEPIVEDSYCFHPDLNYKVIKGGTKVYHNKWQFVSDDYRGFNIDEAKKRTQDWNKIPNIKNMKSKIGNVDFWYRLLRENNLSI